MEALGQQILLQIFIAFFGISQITEGCIEFLRQQQQTTDAIAILSEIRRVLELVGVPFGMICPYMLDFVSFITTLHVFTVAGLTPRLGFQIVGHTSEQLMDLPAVVPLKPKSVFINECFFLVQTLFEYFHQGRRIFPSNVTYNQEHGVLHGRVIGRAAIPYAPCNQNVQKCRDNTQFAITGLFIIVAPQGCEQNWVLKREVVLGAIVNGRQPVCIYRVGGDIAQSGIPTIHRRQNPLQ